MNVNLNKGTKSDNRRQRYYRGRMQRKTNMRVDCGRNTCGVFVVVSGEVSLANSLPEFNYKYMNINVIHDKPTAMITQINSVSYHE